MQKYKSAKKVFSYSPSYTKNTHRLGSVPSKFILQFHTQLELAAWISGMKETL